MGLLASLVGLFNRRLSLMLEPPQPEKESKPIRFGILGAANIAPPALINPALSHPGVVVAAVAARDEARAQAFATKHNIPKVFKSYQDMLDSPDIDAIYNPLPNGLHFEWTIKALKANKHVLLEKPSSNSADETRQMFELAQQKDLVLLEAFHYRFHPANQRLKEIVSSGILGDLKQVRVSMRMPGGLFSSDDIRYNYDLGGGATMDMGCYTISYARWLSGSEPVVKTAQAETLVGKSNVDRAMTAELVFTSPKGEEIQGQIACDLARPWRFGILPHLPELIVKVVCENGEATLDTFPAPTITHSLIILEKGKPKRVEYCHRFPGAQSPGEEWWTTYRHQLEAFVNKVQGREPQYWISPEDSVAQMKIVEEVYAKSGLPPRPTSSYIV